jgi:hypothetical protein
VIIENKTIKIIQEAAMLESHIEHDVESKQSFCSKKITFYNNRTNVPKTTPSN